MDNIEIIERVVIFDEVTDKLKKGFCPFCNSEIATLYLNAEKQTFQCFSCGMSGGVEPLIALAENKSLVEILQGKFGSRFEEERVFERIKRAQGLCRLAEEFFCKQLKEPAGSAAMSYARARGLSEAIINEFGIGFAPDTWGSLINEAMANGYTKDELVEAGLAGVSKNGHRYDRFRNRLMFPIRDIYGNTIAFGGRAIGSDTPKYLNSAETIIFSKRNELFGLYNLKPNFLNGIILTEGYMDTIALHQYGYPCAVASLGTALTNAQARLLSQYTTTVYLTYDADEAGQKATRRAIPILLRAGLNVRILRIPGAKDPDEFLRANPTQFGVLLQNAQPADEYIITECAKNKNKLSHSQIADILAAI